MNRLPLTHPQFNLREISKQMVLLEDHLGQPSKHCDDCIRKHLLTIEALAEEAAALDETGDYRETSWRLAEFARVCLEYVADGGDFPHLGQQVRRVRKKLVPSVFDPRGKVAWRYFHYLTCAHR